MIPVDPNLPTLNHPDYQQTLNWKLTQVLRQMAVVINNFQGSSWDGPHPILGAYHLWIDATGDLRIKSSTPSSDLDGTVIGTQS